MSVGWRTNYHCFNFRIIKDFPVVAGYCANPEFLCQLPGPFDINIGNGNYLRLGNTLYKGSSMNLPDPACPDNTNF